MIYLLISFPGIFDVQLKVCHKLSTKLKREVILGSTSLDDPPQFITVSHTLTSHSEIWKTMNHRFKQSNFSFLLVSHRN